MKIKKIFLTCFLIGTFQTILFATTAESYYEKGLKAANNEEKIKYLNIALKLDESFEKAIMERAETYFQISLFGEAENDIEYYLSKFPINPGILVLKEKIAIQNGLLDKAQEFLEQALKLDPKHPEANLRMGLLLITLGNLKQNPGLYAEALHFLINVPTGTSSYNLAIFQAAKCHEFAEQYKEAQSAYENLTKCEPNNPAHFFNLGLMQYFNEQYSPAVASLETAVNLSFQDKSFKSFYAVFQYYINVNNLNNAVAASYQLGLIFDKIPKNPLGDLFLKKITPEDFVIQFLAESAKLSLKRKEVMESEMNSSLGLYYILEKNIDKAIEYFEKVNISNKFGAYYFNLSRYEIQRLKFSKELKND
ncbi:MAG: hypothetical protein ACD_79C01156G0002 [uncultured bacterium]|nr:MAG: hypothetical protein ACD_79C01156G0002 [uncultured bacterium]